MSGPKKVVSRAQARKLIELVANGQIKGRDGLSGASVVAEMFKRSGPFSELPERITQKEGVNDG
jgi:hypothetical protein